MVEWWGPLSGNNAYIHNDSGVTIVSSWWIDLAYCGDNIRIHNDSWVTSVLHDGLVGPTVW